MKYSIDEKGYLILNGEYQNCAFVETGSCGQICAAFETVENPIKAQRDVIGEICFPRNGRLNGTLVVLHCVKREIFIEKEEK